MTFSRLLADIRREEATEERKQNAQNGGVDTAATVVFETNQFCVTARSDDDGEQMDAKTFINMIERMIR